MQLATLDIIIIALYGIALFGIALFVSRQPAGESKSTEDYFLASKALPWWAIGASLIAANISAEQIIGQSGQGFVLGIAIAAYELQAALVLIIAAKYFLPIFLKRGIYTMPQFLDQRYGGGVKSLMSVYWIALYTAVNLTTVLWLGGLAISSLSGLDVMWSMTGLAAFAVLYSIYGGLKAVALTDIIQVVILIVGGLIITWISLDMVSGGNGPVSGFGRLTEEVPGHFNMILDKDHPNYQSLPGIWTLLGGLWVLHFSYWGFNQYIIQRALGAESLQEGQKGLAFAAFLKLFIPVIVVIPGIAALILAQDGVLPLAELSERSDRTYGVLMTLLPEGLRGIVFAALIAAVVSSLASMMNSISTIFTMDIYRTAVANKPETHYVLVGRITALLAMVIALFLAKPFLGGFESAFQTVQEYTGFIAPGVVAIFLLGFFDKRANASGAFAVLISSVAASFVFWALTNPAALGGVGQGLLNMTGMESLDMPFVVRIWFVFMICMGAGIVASRVTSRTASAAAIELKDVGFKTTFTFNVLAVSVVAVLVAIYIFFW